MGRLIAVNLAEARRNMERHRLRVTSDNSLLAPVPDGTDLFAGLTRPPGLVGELADWITATARRPNPVLSLGAALCVVGTLPGRRVGGPSKSGTHLYIAALGPTGCGTQAGLDGIQTSMQAAGARQHIGPSGFTTMPALVNFLKRQPLAVCPMDEFGSFLKRVQNPKASGWERALSGTLRSAWGSSFRQFQTLEYAGLAADWVGPTALSLYGVSTPEEFYDALNADDISNGLLNRFLLLQTDDIPQDREPAADPFNLPDQLADGLARLFQWKSTGNLGTSAINVGTEVKPDYIPWGDGAEAAWRDLRSEIDAFMRADRERAAYVVRTAEIAVRLATIVAIGRAGVDAVVETADLEWGRAVAVASARLMAAAGAEIGEELSGAKLRKGILRVVKQKGGCITRAKLMTSLGGRFAKAKDVDEALNALSDMEVIAMERALPDGRACRMPMIIRLVN